MAPALAKEERAGLDGGAVSGRSGVREALAEEERTGKEAWASCKGRHMSVRLRESRREVEIN